METFGFIVNGISLLAVLVAAYVFFSDKTRYWNFLGYKPTAIVLIFDDITNRVLLVKRSTVRALKRDYPWHFPQGGIYASDFNTAVNTVLAEEFDAKPNMYDFNRIYPLGVKRIGSRAVDKKYYFTSLSLFPSLKGKGYVACIVYTNQKQFLK